MNSLRESKQNFVTHFRFEGILKTGTSDCPEVIFFDALEGLFIRGTISPPVEQVQIKISHESDESLHLQALDKQLFFKVLFSIFVGYIVIDVTRGRSLGPGPDLEL